MYYTEEIDEIIENLRYRYKAAQKYQHYPTKEYRIRQLDEILDQTITLVIIRQEQKPT